jgi:hypothetical protein
MHYILSCRFDVQNNYLYQEEIDRETNKYYITKAGQHILKKKLNRVIIHTSQGVKWGSIYVATYSKPEDVQAGIEEIKELRMKWLNRIANQGIEMKGESKNAEKE